MARDAVLRFARARGARALRGPDAAHRRRGDCRRAGARRRVLHRRGAGRAHLRDRRHQRLEPHRAGERNAGGVLRARPVPMSRRERNLVLAAMCVALATVVSAVSSLNVALPDVARDLHATQTQLQWIVDAYAVVFSGLLLLAGALGDRLGRRPVLLVGLVVFSAAAAGGMLVDSPGALIAVRAVMGLGAAAIMPSTLSIITNVFQEGERDRAVSIWAGVAGGSALLGLLVSGALLEAFSWDSIFGFSAVLGLIALVAGFRLAPNSKLDRA